MKSTINYFWLISPTNTIAEMFSNFMLHHYSGLRVRYMITEIILHWPDGEFQYSRQINMQRIYGIQLFYPFSLNTADNKPLDSVVLSISVSTPLALALVIISCVCVCVLIRETDTLNFGHSGISRDSAFSPHPLWPVPLSAQLRALT